MQIDVHSCRLAPDNAVRLAGGCDLVVDCTDNYAARYLINDVCRICGIPMIHGSITAFQGQAAVFCRDDGPTYRCLFPAPDEALVTGHPLGLMGVLPGLIGCVQASEAIKLLTGVGRVLSGRLLLWDALSGDSRTFTIRPSPANLAAPAALRGDFY